MPISQSLWPRLLQTPTSHGHSSSSGLYRSMVTSVSGVISLIPDGSYMIISHGSGTSSSRVSASTVSRILTFAQSSPPAQASNQWLMTRSLCHFQVVRLRADGIAFGLDALLPRNNSHQKAHTPAANPIVYTATRTATRTATATRNQQTSDTEDHRKPSSQQHVQLCSTVRSLYREPNCRTETQAIYPEDTACRELLRTHRQA